MKAKILADFQICISVPLIRASSQMRCVTIIVFPIKNNMKFHLSPRKYDTKQYFWKTTIKKKKKEKWIPDSTLHLDIFKLLWSFLRFFIWKTSKQTDSAFYLTDVKLAYTSADTNKSFLKLVSSKQFESSPLFLNFVQNFEKTVMT